MSKKLISELSDQEINYWVGKIEGINCSINHEGKCIRHLPWDVMIGTNDFIIYDPCNNPAKAWPIIQNNRITVSCGDNESSAWDNKKGIINGVWFGSNGLIAAMRCRIAMVYGDSVEIDDE
jgi:hypothetical protein